MAVKNLVRKCRMSVDLLRAKSRERLWAVCVYSFQEERCEWDPQLNKSYIENVFFFCLKYGFTMIQSKPYRVNEEGVSSTLLVSVFKSFTFAFTAMSVWKLLHFSVSIVCLYISPRNISVLFWGQSVWCISQYRWLTLIVGGGVG